MITIINYRDKYLILLNIVITEKTFRLIKRIYRYKAYTTFSKLNSKRIIKNDNERYIGHGLSDERYELKALELTFP